MAYLANIEQCNSYDNHTESKPASNSLIVQAGNFLKLRGWYIRLAWPFDPIEWVSETSWNYWPDNESNWKWQVLYRPARRTDRYKVDTTNGTLLDDRVGDYFNITLDQRLDVSSHSLSIRQLRLEKILWSNQALVSIVVSTGSPVWPMWPTWFTWATWPIWLTWATWSGATWLTWATGVSWSQWATGATWSVWATWIWSQWATWPQWLKWLQREWTWNSWSSYSVDDAVFYNGNAYVSLTNWNINNTPPAYPTWVDSFWSILAQQWATWPSWLPWPAWGATWATWPIGLTWATWIWATGFGATGATWPQWPQWQPWDFTTEYVEFFKWSDQVYFVPWVAESAVFVTFSNTLGNAWMVWVWTQYMQTLTQWTFHISQEIKCETQFDWLNCWVTAVRNLLVITNSFWTVNYVKTGVCDDKMEDRFTNNSIRTYTLSASALIDLNAWDRVYCISTSACDTITPWNVAIKWPSTYQFTWLWYYAWSKMFIRKVSN